MLEASNSVGQEEQHVDARHISVFSEALAHGIAFRRLKDLHEPLCLDMLNYWKEVRGEATMPQPSWMDPVRFARHMPRLLVVQVNWEPFDLSYRLIGEEVVAAHGANYRGMRVLEAQSHKGHFSEVLWTFYRFVAEAGRPYGVAGTMEYEGHGPVTVEAVYLPLSIDGKRTDRIIGAVAATPLPKSSFASSRSLL